MASIYFNSCSHIQNLVYTPNFKKENNKKFLQCLVCKKLLCSDCVFSCISCKRTICHSCIGYSPLDDSEPWPLQSGSLHCTDCQPDRQYPLDSQKKIPKEWLDSPKSTGRALDSFILDKPKKNKKKI